MPAYQNFSVPEGESTTVNFDVGPDEGQTLAGAEITWSMYAQDCGAPSGDALVTKTMGSGITVTDNLLLTFALALEREDTLDLDLGNYYHELTIKDADNNYTTPTVGIVTITQTANRPE